MSLELRESIPLSRFIYEPDWTPLKGTYILPLKFFGPERSLDPNNYLEVVRVVPVSGTDVAITRGGGLFVRDRGQYRTREATDRLASVLNMLLAELTLQGLVSHPITDTDIQNAKLIGRHVSITGGSGFFADRTWGPYTLLASPKRDLGSGYTGSSNDYWPVNFYWLPHDATILERVNALTGASKLKGISPTLPTLFVAAVYHAARHDLAEGIVTAWIVCEQILSYLWDEYVAHLTGKERQKRLRDDRTYSASVRAEVLLTCGLFEEEPYDLFNKARKLRNDLAHRSLMDQDAAATSVFAMQAMLKRVGVSTDRLPGYVFKSLGVAQPRTALEPEFDFK